MLPPSHGQRSTYQSGCRCAACRAANAAAAHRPSIRPVDAEAARRQLEGWQRQGIGLRQAARLTGLSTSTLLGVRAGRVLTLRPATLARLDVRPSLAAGALVRATTTWRSIDSLEREGFTRRELAARLGARSQQLQMGRRTVRGTTAAKVATLLAHWT